MHTQTYQMKSSYVKAQAFPLKANIKGGIRKDTASLFYSILLGFGVVFFSSMTD